MRPGRCEFYRETTRESGIESFRFFASLTIPQLVVLYLDAPDSPKPEEAPKVVYDNPKDAQRGLGGLLERMRQKARAKAQQQIGE